MTNDHYFADGPLRVAEELYGPWSWATNVQYCNAATEVGHVLSESWTIPDLLRQSVICRQVSGTFPGANGINLWEDRLFVADSTNGTLTIFQIHDDHSLTPLQVVVSNVPHSDAVGRGTSRADEPRRRIWALQPTTSTSYRRPETRLSQVGDDGADL